VALYLLGGVHGGELGSCDILVSFIDRLERAYLEGTSVTFPNLTFTAEDIRAIFGLLDIVVFPQANPDGRQYSMSHLNPGWRKNRRTEAPNSPAEPGVDLNRNFDFLWDFTRRFAHPTDVNTSTRPGGDHYRGPAPFSEPESRNIRWLFESQPNIRYFVDLHSYGRHILHSWGDDAVQSTDPEMSFLNPSYDDKRGIQNDASYGEYMSAGDLDVALSLANSMKDAIRAVRGSSYQVASTFDFGTVSGTSDDYFYSRHFVDATIPTVISQVIEWGEETRPPYVEMQTIIEEISAALFALCLKITRL
jgi:murein tripeptide amidase MpaA